jgi:allantoate deiminase
MKSIKGVGDNMDWITQRIRFHIDQLSQFGKNNEGGITRLPFTKANRLAADYLIQAMKDCGLEVFEDEVGNIYGKWEVDGAIGGQGGEKAASEGKYLAIGSHYDSVINGGAYDGIAGIVVGLVIAEYYQREHRQPKQNYLLIAFNDEEGVRFGTGFLGSRTFLGKVTTAELRHTKDREGISIYDAIKAYGKDPEKIGDMPVALDKIEGYLEVHVEQGPVLDQLNKEIGIVHTIVGMQRYVISIMGESNHAGTTPMSMRLDPTLTACKVITAILEKGKALGENTTTTVGVLNATPGAVNIIPEKVAFSVDFRSVDKKNLIEIQTLMLEQIETLCKKNNLKYLVEQKLDVNPVAMNVEMCHNLLAVSQKIGFSTMTLPSGAGHDALPIGTEMKTALVFVPSKNGCSHCKEEYTSEEAISKAVRVVLNCFEKSQ